LFKYIGKRFSYSIIFLFVFLKKAFTILYFKLKNGTFLLHHFVIINILNIYLFFYRSSIDYENDVVYFNDFMMIRIVNIYTLA